MNFILLVASAAEIAIATIILWYVVDLLTTMPANMRMVVPDYSGSRPRGNLNVPRATDSRWVSVGPCAYHTMKLGATVPPPRAVSAST
jgi:hypothetical protein